MVQAKDYLTERGWKAYISDLMDSSKLAVYKSVLLLHALQTPEERYKWETLENNGIGVGKIDAKIYNDLATKIYMNQFLTEGEFEMVKNKSKKYWRQLMNLSLGHIKVTVKNPKIFKELK